METFFIIIFCFSVYFLPSIVAWNRDMKSFNGVLLLDLFLGWTFLGWVAALVWSVTGDKE